MTDDLHAASMAWMDALWDDDAALLWTVQRDHHMTRDSAWYALGLLQRGDADRAARALEQVLANQFLAPDTPFDGTFRRAPEEADPPSDPVMWIHYDPNWRQFIGTTFAVIIDRYHGMLSAQLVDALRGSIARAVVGEGDDRVSPHYANIALMKAWLDAWSGRGAHAEAFAEQIAAAFFENNTFLEYNSPTYYGIDLWALALWRESTPVLQDLGARMEAALWRDVARFYHAGLRNMCGPYDRAYGMDMTTHATPLGLWIWDAIGREQAPFPETTGKFRHPHDLCMAPCVKEMGAVVPADVLGHLTVFSGERAFTQTVTAEPERVATAWLSEDIMFGAQTGPTSGIGLFQHHHATAHWRRDEGAVGWMRLMPDVVADAVAEPGELRVTTRTTTPITFEFYPASDNSPLTIETNASDPDASSDGRLTYQPVSAETTFVFRV